MDKEIVTSQSLMDDASTSYGNMVASRDWKTEVNKHTQIIALTTQISELKKEFNQAKALNNTFTPAPASSGAGSNKFEQWRLMKVDNKEEFNMIVKDGKHTIGAINTSILRLMFKECMSFISRLIMRHGWLARHPLKHDMEKEAKRKL